MNSLEECKSNFSTNPWNIPEGIIGKILRRNLDDYPRKINRGGIATGFPRELPGKVRGGISERCFAGILGRTVRGIANRILEGSAVAIFRTFL